MKNTSRTLTILGVILVLAAAGAAAYFFWPRGGDTTVAGGRTVGAPAMKPDATFDPVPALYPDDLVLGKTDAPVTIIEYASLTCPHCADFHNKTLPQVKKDYIDTGKVKLVYRDYPLNRPALQASLLVHCVPQDRAFGLLEVLFKQQVEWAGGEDPLKALEQMGVAAGIDPAKFDSCQKDKAINDRILQRYQEASDKYKLEATPTFIINGRKYSGFMPFDIFETLIQPNS